MEPPPPATQLTPVVDHALHTIDSPLWASPDQGADRRPGSRTASTQIEPHGPPQGAAGGLDNFVEAAKALRGEPHGAHKGYVFSNAWVHQTVEAMSLALMVDPQGDTEILAAQAKMRATLEDWIPKILAAQHPTATCRRRSRFRMAPDGAAARAIRGPSAALATAAAITKATSPATSSSRPSITT